MKGQRTVKYFIEFDGCDNYGSNQIQISAEQYWKEFDNCMYTMNEHNKDCEEYDEFTFKEYNKESESAKVIQRVFYFGSVSVYLIENRCKEGYRFKTKKEMN